MSDEKKTVSKTRNWATILYPESCVANWPEVVSGWKIPAFASPVHDKDVDKDGKPKKPHVHLLMMFPGAKSRACVEKLVKPLGAVGLEAVQSVTGMARYLCHLDDTDKAQYDPKAVGVFGGADYEATIAIKGKNGDIEAMCAIMEWCDENKCYSFARLMRYARTSKKEWLPVLCSSKHSVIYRYLRSCEWEYQQEVTESESLSRKSASPSPEASPNRLASFPKGTYLNGDGQTELSAVHDSPPVSSGTPWDNDSCLMSKRR